MIQQKLLTVTVPCYNSEAYMRGCVDSLLAGGERVEIIIIDDGSTDNTGAIADEYADDFETQLAALQQRRPECDVAYSVVIGEKEYALDTRTLDLKNQDISQLLERLADPAVRPRILHDIFHDTLRPLRW